MTLNAKYTVLPERIEQSKALLAECSDLEKSANSRTISNLTQQINGNLNILNTIKDSIDKKKRLMEEKEQAYTELKTKKENYIEQARAATAAGAAVLEFQAEFTAYEDNKEAYRELKQLNKKLQHIGITLQHKIVDAIQRSVTVQESFLNNSNTLYKQEKSAKGISSRMKNIRNLS